MVEWKIPLIAINVGRRIVLFDRITEDGNQISLSIIHMFPTEREFIAPAIASHLLNHN